MTAIERHLMSQYIPPPGALQFEFEEKDLPVGTVRIPHLRDSGYIWVKTPTTNTARICDCAKTYPVIIESLHPEAATAVREHQAAGGGIPAVCAHAGRIIE